MYRLRVKTKGGGQYPLTDCVNGDSTLNDLLIAVQKVTSISPERQKILTGFPPKPIQGNFTTTLKMVGVRNGDVLIVEDIEPSTNTTITTPVMNTLGGVITETCNLDSTVERVTELPQSQDKPIFKPQSKSDSLVKEFKDPHFTEKLEGILLKKVVPSDNSCLFASIYFLINGGNEAAVNAQEVQNMRKVVASMVKDAPDQYNEVLLEKSNSEYCKWILKDTSWGGAIELSILSQYYEMEIVALDAKTGVLNRFGEDKGYDHRMIVMYDGIHYDPLYMELHKGGTKTVFDTSDESVLFQATEIAIEAKQSGQYTDTNSFRLECKQCGTIITGEKHALSHATQTGHSKFEEVR